MTLSAKKHPVELLRDGKGIYGIGVAKEAETDHRPRDLILRHDRLPELETSFSGYPILQMITGGFRHGMFCRTAEELHRQVIHHEMLRRAGLAWPPPDVPFHWNGRYWSSDPRQQTRNRQIYHGLRLGSLSIVNRLISQALDEAANPEVIKIARRFRFRYRYSIYRAAALNPRALQITVVFPVLSLALYARPLAIVAQGGSRDEDLTNEAAAACRSRRPFEKNCGLNGRSDGISEGKARCRRLGSLRDQCAALTRDSSTPTCQAHFRG